MSWCVDCITTGVWTPNNTTSTSYDSDITKMEETQWIDEQTAMVQFSCAIVEPNEELVRARNIELSNPTIIAVQVAYIFYTVEFTPTGRVFPNPPYINVDRVDRWPYSMATAPLLP